MMACDICLKTADCEKLNPMLDFSVEGKMVICGNCAKGANKMLDKYRHMAWVRTKKKLKQMQKDAKQ